MVSSIYWAYCGYPVLDTTLCDKSCQWLAAGQWFSLGIPVSSAKNNDRHDITEILLKKVVKHHSPWLSYLCPLICLFSRLLNLALQSVDSEYTLRVKKRVVCTNLDRYVFICTLANPWLIIIRVTTKPFYKTSLHGDILEPATSGI